MTRPVVHLIAHTHWDREWYLPLGAFRSRLVVALDRALAQLEADSRIASFLLDGQAVLVADYLEVRSERRATLERLLVKGRLEAGPWYVLADEQIPSGESLLRNLLLGAAVLRGWGRRLPVLYSPDAFGHPPSFPLIGAECGFAFGVVWRGIDTQAAGGRDLFWWEAQDGRRILVYHLPPDGYEIGSNLLVPDDRLSDAWARVASQVLPRAATRHAAVFVGADHHAMAPELGALAERLARVAPESEFRFSSLAGFLESARAEGGTTLPVVRGEERATTSHAWSLQGVHGTRASLKRLNSTLELELTRTAEPLVALTVDEGSDAAILQRAWRDLVQCHFHDAIAGCANDAVARAMRVRFEDVAAASGEVTRGTLDRLAGHDPDLAREQGSQGSRLLLWNRQARDRGGVVTAEVTFFRRDILVGPPGGPRPRTGTGATPFILLATRPDGALIEIAPQILGLERGLERVDARRHYPDLDEVDRVRIAFPLLEALPGLGARAFQLRPGRGKPLETFASAEGRLVWNGRVGFAVDRDGTGVLRRVGMTRPFQGLFGLESEDDLGDTYTFCPAPKPRRRRPTRAGRVRLTERGPLVAGLEWGVSIRTGRSPGARGSGTVSASISVQVIGDSPVVRARIRLDNRAEDHRLRLRFPTELKSVPVLAGTHFGVLRRAAGSPTGRSASSEVPVATAPAHRFAAVARGARGLAVFAPGFFEYEWTHGGDLLVTLLRSVGELSRGDLHTRPGHAGWPTPTPEAQCLGPAVVEVAIAAVTEEDLALPDRLERLWEEAFLPPIGHWIRDFHAADAGETHAGIALEGDGLVFSGLKPAEDGRGAIFRCYNAREVAVMGRLRLTCPAVRAVRVRADETEIEGLLLTEGGRELSFTVPERGVYSTRLDWKP